MQNDFAHPPNKQVIVLHLGDTGAVSEALAADLRDKLGQLLALLSKGSILTAQPTERVSLDPSRNVATVDGEEVPVTADQLAVVAVLHKVAPGWVGEHDFRRAGILGNYGRIVKRMNPAIRKLIETKAGAGHRLTTR